MRTLSNARCATPCNNRASRKRSACANQELEQRVQDRTAELARVNDTLQSEIAERKRAEEALRDADRRKDEFVATLAHELHNPLAPISAALELFDGENNSNQIEDLRAMMSRQVQHLVRLIDDLLDVSRISQGKLNLRRAAIDLQEVVDIALDVSQPMIQLSKHRLELDLPEGPLTIGWRQSSRGADRQQSID